jgi:hypothetical protein
MYRDRHNHRVKVNCRKKYENELLKSYESEYLKKITEKKEMKKKLEYMSTG